MNWIMVRKQKKGSDVPKKIKKAIAIFRQKIALSEAKYED